MSVLLIGSQRPTLLAEPDGAVDWELSDIAVEFAESSCGYVLDEWQRWLVRWAFVRRADKLWAARDFGIEVTRQSGKNVVLEVIELCAVFLFGERLVIHSAQRADVSHEHFLSLRDRIKNSPELMDAMPTWQANDGVVRSHGMESIELASGARILFKARAQSSGRGPRPQRIVLDEALVLAQGTVGNMAPGMTAQRNPQIIFASSSPKADSEVLHGLRERAANPEPGERLFYAAWNNPPGTDVNDRDAWYRANPSLGMGRMTEESLLSNRRLMVDEEFLREHLGVPEEPLERSQVIPDAVWSALVEAGSLIVSHKAWALSVSPNRKWSCFGVAGRRADGRLHVEWLERKGGTAWVEDSGATLFASAKLPLRIHKSGPEGSFIVPLRARGVEVVEVSSAEVAAATGQFIDAANGDQLRHLGQGSLDHALKGAVLRTSADGAALWSQRNSQVDITALMACTVAAGGVPIKEPKPALMHSW